MNFTHKAIVLRGILEIKRIKFASPVLEKLDNQ